MSNRKHEMYEYKQALFLMRNNKSDRAIAKSGVMGRTKAKELRNVAIKFGWLNENTTLPTESQIAELLASEIKISKHKALPYYKIVLDWLNQGISIRVIHNKLIEEHKYEGHYTSICRLVSIIKETLPKDMTIPLHFTPGEAAQVDFGKGPEIFDSETKKEVKTWVFVMTLCWSRHHYAEIVKDQSIETWLGCHRRALEWFGGVPGKLIIDNLKSAITKACYYEPTVQRSYADYAEIYGFIISPCPVRDPQKKGRVEAGVKYVKNNFFPLKKFDDIITANKQLQKWVLETAGNRTHGSTYKKPLNQFTETEKPTLKPLPEVPTEICTWSKVKVYRDCHVRFDKCKYSAPYVLYDKELWLKANETTISIYQEHIMIAMHARSYEPGDVITLTEHLPPNAQKYLQQTPEWCLEQAELVGVKCLEVVKTLLDSKILDYHRAVQGIIKLTKKYGLGRLEAACNRVIIFNCISYKEIKQILKKGLEYEVLPNEYVFDEIAEIYSGSSKYCRKINDITH